MRAARRPIPTRLGFAIFTAIPLAASAPAAAAPTAPAAAVPALLASQSGSAPTSTTRLSDADLEELLAPIALYPDPLLAEVLAASIYPDQVKEAATAVSGGADAARIDAANWEPPVKAVAKVPQVVKFLSDNMDWTTALGEAYVVQGPDVMKAVQNLRARAYANGALQTTPQQTVTTQGDTIIIQPAQPSVIYVPTYNPSVVYVDNTANVVAAGLIGFGVGVAFAAALDCDWHYGGVCWGGSWGWRGGYADVDIDRNVNINRNVNVGDVNIGSGNVNIDRTNVGNNVGNSVRPGAEGTAWQPNRDRMSSSLRNGQTRELSNFKGAGSQPSVASRVPGMGAGSQPIASRPAPRPSTANRPAAGGAANAPANVPARPAAKPAARPAGTGGAGAGAARAPAAAPKVDVPKPATAAPQVGGRSGGVGGGGFSAGGGGGGGGRASAFNSGGGGGNRAAASSRGAASRGGGGGARGGGRGR